MGLEKKFRTYTEKTTSIDQPIEVVQYGRFVTRISSSGEGTLAVILPTTIPNVKSVQLFPLNSSGAGFKQTYCDLKLYNASHSLVKTALSKKRNIVQHTAVSNIDETAFIIVNGKLYESQKPTAWSALQNYSATGASYAQASATTIWQRNLTIASNGKNYLKVLGKPLLSKTSIASLQTLGNAQFSYEVRGYE